MIKSSLVKVSSAYVSKAVAPSIVRARLTPGVRAMRSS